MKRQVVLLVALAASLLVALWASGLEGEGEPTVGRRPAGKSPRRNAVSPPPDLSALAMPRPASAGMEAGGDLFPVRSFRPPPPPPAVERPTAPPLPYRHGGLLEDGGPPAAFLAEGDRLHVVRVGDVVDGRYRVSAVQRGRIDLVYLPLNQTQSLVSGALP